MSWQDYIDQQLMCTLPSGGQLSHAAIVGTDGGVWAQSESFPAITEEEIAALVKGFDDPSQLAQNGLRIGGEKYMLVAGEPGEVLRGKQGSAGCTIKRTKTAMVVGIYGEGVPHGDCNIVVEGLADYLLDTGL
ncbi:hypothetical protein CHLNCDRAFT_27467 [Chlorella variabilis]|uniref:Profilin n=1 Tax=Chlorella variabilis TaxID=554065 RepID=E1ZQQ4_CHLVA|nr:hypothetical protein CHLNCDRAFT_27467 [Chlorella variabilis]EFN51757.1 hypothetical protein CHLNCDRAFT_27467 [Chlorella variabilis]|eukprot:XP_005843859.1 hypothetical protein CHLNCDRAFT_27467 [Chlorella variabilis]